MIWQKIVGGWLLALGTVLIPTLPVPWPVTCSIILIALILGFFLVFRVTQMDDDLKAPLAVKFGKIYEKIKSMDPEKTYTMQYSLNRLAVSAKEERDKESFFRELPWGDMGDPEIRNEWLRIIERDMKLSEEKRS